MGWGVGGGGAWGSCPGRGRVRAAHRPHVHSPGPARLVWRGRAARAHQQVAHAPVSRPQPERLQEVLTSHVQAGAMMSLPNPTCNARITVGVDVSKATLEVALSQ